MARNHVPLWIPVLSFLIAYSTVNPSKHRSTRSNSSPRTPASNKMCPAFHRVPEPISDSEPAFMKSTQCPVPNISTSKEVVTGNRHQSLKKHHTKPIQYKSCYTAPDEDLLMSRYSSFEYNKMKCSLDHLDNIRETAYVKNPSVVCIAGFQEVQTYFNLIARSSTTSRYGDYWCSIKRVCCSV